MNTFAQVLQRQLDIVAGILLGNLATMVKPRLILEDAETASTDSVLWVRMPKEFLGQKLDNHPDLAAGLLAHEIGHWLQPVKEIEVIEDETGLQHAVVNIFLDVHGENLVESIFPLFNNGMKSVRRAIKTKMINGYLREIGKTNDFASIAQLAMLYSRYAEPDYSCATTITSDLCRALTDLRIRTLVDLRLPQIMEVSCGDLPKFIREVARDYPELCDSSGKGKRAAIGGGDPISDATSSGGAALPLVCLGSAALEGNGIGAGKNANLDSPSQPYGLTRPSPEVVNLSRKLAIRWSTPRGSTSIMAPGRFDRLGAVRGDPMPFSMSQHANTRQGESLKVCLAVDWSGSMDGSRWQIAIDAARAIAMAIRNNGGDVRVVFFAESAWHAPDYSGNALFAQSCGIDLSRAHGDDTELRWLPYAWQALPYHRFVILTDGRAHVPLAIPRSSRQRTSAILIQPNDQEVFELASVVASTVLTVHNLKDLAAVWASLIPRRWVA